MLHPQNPVPAVLLPSEKNTAGAVPISSNFAAAPTPVQPPVRNDFPQMVPPVMQPHSSNQSGVFAGEWRRKLAVVYVKMTAREIWI